eukprot:CAMPEP_0201539688 /NCGR_PEP_ID=MMETSP0161_2-20130828/70540_1 /ASSEMBLY_ACC=CAM_ASM_000251 /TAXON_ID=180227 /ORGANISM="Neoparamoeba aestuarina, Strain SoJaBio B1-5/56/2" /LENGTH=83 /DNA_ID=CAMNT_0047947099 /DNA_START=715 /DNA_END=965 /DNA_ORIENTATION=+
MKYVLRHCHWCLARGNREGLQALGIFGLGVGELEEGFVKRDEGAGEEARGEEESLGHMEGEMEVGGEVEDEEEIQEAFVTTKS